MATPVLVPISEYLKTTYRPDCDFVDGELKERNVGERPHGSLQGLLASLFLTNRQTWGLLPSTEQRVQTSANHFRIPDVCVIRPVAGEYIVRTAPVVCIEVLSKDDTLDGMRERVDDFLAMGVEHVWVFDPLGHVAWRATATGYDVAEGELAIAGTPVRIALPELFGELEEMLAGRL